MHLSLERQLLLQEANSIALWFEGGNYILDIVSGINGGNVGQGIFVTGFSCLAFQVFGDIYCYHTVNALEEKCPRDI